MTIIAITQMPHRIRSRGLLKALVTAVPLCPLRTLQRLHLHPLMPRSLICHRIWKYSQRRCFALEKNSLYLKVAMCTSTCEQWARMPHIDFIRPSYPLHLSGFRRHWALHFRTLMRGWQPAGARDQRLSRDTRSVTTRILRLVFSLEAWVLIQIFTLSLKTHAHILPLANTHWHHRPWQESRSLRILWYQTIRKPSHRRPKYWMPTKRQLFQPLQVQQSQKMCTM